MHLRQGLKTVHVACMRKMKIAYKILPQKPYGKRPPRGPSLRQENNMKISFTEIMLKGVDWIQMVQDRNW